MKRIVSMLLAVIMLIALFAGCGTKTATSTDTASSPAAAVDAKTEAPAATELKGKITFMTHRTDKADNVLTDIAKEFMAKNPGVEVTVEPDKDEATLKTRIAANEMPDIMQVPAQLGITRNDYPTYFVDISDLGFTKDNVYFYENCIGPDNKLYTLSIGVNYCGIIYNRNAFKTAGIEKAPTNIDEFYAACEKLKAAGIVPLASNFKDKWPLGNWCDALPNDLLALDNYKNTLVSKDFLANEPGSMLESLNILRTLNEKGYLEKDLMSTNWDSSKKDIAQGKFAMMYLGTWFPAQMIENGAKAEDVSMMPFPGTKALGLGADIYYGVTTSSKAPDAAKAFFQFMWKDGYMPLKIGMIPVNKDYKPTEPFLKDLLSFNLPTIEGVADSADYQALKNKAEIDTSVLVQEYVTAANPQEVVDKYNKKWADAKKALGK